MCMGIEPVRKKNKEWKNVSMIQIDKSSRSSLLEIIVYKIHVS